MANVQVNNLADGQIELSDYIHINKAGLDRKELISDVIALFQANLTHAGLTDVGTNTHAQIDTHIANSAIHRQINDSATSTTSLWSSNKISSELSSHTHPASAIISGTLANPRISQSSVTQHQAAINHNALMNYVANQHIDWTVDAGVDVHANNIGASAVTQHQGSINHNALTNYVANQHIDHSSVLIQAGIGLSGGGSIAATRTIDLNLNDLTAVTSAASTGELGLYVAGVGQRKITFANFQTSLNHDSLSGFVNNEHIDHSTVSISPGQGLSGGGNITASRTLSLNISGLAQINQATLDENADFVVVYDQSAGQHRKVLLGDLPVTETILQNNEGQNIGVGGQNVYVGMNGTFLQFRSINSASSKLSVNLDAPNNRINLDVVEGNININNLSGASTFNANTVGGLAAASFLRSNTSDSFTSGQLVISAGADLVIDGQLFVRGVDGGADSWVYFRDVNSSTNRVFGWSNTNNDWLGHNEAGSLVRFWHSGNDGPASGLDADLLDGQQGAYYLPAASYTAADVRTKLLTVDGAGSGIDSDLLDGLQSTAFVRSNANTAITATHTFNDTFRQRFGTDGDMQFYHSGGLNYTEFNATNWYWRNGATNMAVFQPTTGNLHLDGNVFGGSTLVGSDIKIKNLKNRINDVWEKIDKVEGWQFDYKKDGKASAGLIANQWLDVLPELVEEYEKPSGGKHLVLNYNGTIGFLIEFCKQVKKEIEDIKSSLEG